VRGGLEIDLFENDILRGFGLGFRVLLGGLDHGVGVLEDPVAVENHGVLAEGVERFGLEVAVLGEVGTVEYEAGGFGHFVFRERGGGNELLRGLFPNEVSEAFTTPKVKVRGKRWVEEKRLVAPVLLQKYLHPSPPAKVLAAVSDCWREGALEPRRSSIIFSNLFW